MKKATVVSKVLLQAKKEAEKQASEQNLAGGGGGKPWGQGHWTNRK